MADLIDLTDNPYWRSSGMSDGYTQYKIVEVSPGKGKWVPNIEAMRKEAARERHRRALFWALRSRILTDKEMAEVDRYGDYLNIDNNVSFKQSEKTAELNAALLQQFRLRQAAGKK